MLKHTIGRWTCTEYRKILSLHGFSRHDLECVSRSRQHIVGPGARRLRRHFFKTLGAVLKTAATMDI
ncbi:hypothetical protein EYF80_026546 [Liparis tanakae]|uniref:Uncharacterized protein n=1 Tax=Liparis tanakae TaxID=230148 RepID=A0A4Z2HDW0_9TELE|nr:hypothetical protein EYF80_026546 [Liparis tanakae]